MGETSNLHEPSSLSVDVGWADSFLTHQIDNLFFNCKFIFLSFMFLNEILLDTNQYTVMKSLQHVHLINTNFLRWQYTFSGNIQCANIRYPLHKKLAYSEIVTIKLQQLEHLFNIQTRQLENWCLPHWIKVLNMEVMLYLNSTNGLTNVSNS